MRERLIGQFNGDQAGPLVVVIGAMHGNEPAGVHALQNVFTLLEQAAASEPNFQMKGTLVGLVGNVRAFTAKRRFMDHDLNRSWGPDAFALLQQRPHRQYTAEDWELHELQTLLLETLAEKQPQALVVLDVHTTSAQGGIFSIPVSDAASISLAKAMHAPVILGMLDGVINTFLQYVAGGGLWAAAKPSMVHCSAFEAGQHDDPLSISRATAAILHVLHDCGCLTPNTLHSPYDAILEAYAQPLPKVTRLAYTHRIHPSDGFVMRPGYRNFQTVRAGEYVADDQHGPVEAPVDGLMLMPLYQPQGAEGFFLVQVEES